MYRLFIIFLIYSSPSYGQKTVLAGSKTLLPAIKQVLKNSNRVFELKASNNKKALAALLNGDVHIAATTRKMTPRELHEFNRKSWSIKTYHVAYDAICVIVHPSNQTKSLNKNQLDYIFFHEESIPLWQKIGYNKGYALALANEDKPSSAMKIFKNLLNKRLSPFGKHTNTKHSHQENVRLVSENQHAISLVPIGYVNSQVRTVPIQLNSSKSIDCKTFNVKSQAYPLSNELFLITRYPPDKEITDFLLNFLSHTGQTNIQESYLLPVRRIGD